jgi:hypothetical protein
MIEVDRILGMDRISFLGQGRLCRGKRAARALPLEPTFQASILAFAVPTLDLDIGLWTCLQLSRE